MEIKHEVVSRYKELIDSLTKHKEIFNETQEELYWVTSQLVGRWHGYDDITKAQKEIGGKRKADKDRLFCNFREERDIKLLKFLRRKRIPKVAELSYANLSMLENEQSNHKAKREGWKLSISAINLLECLIPDWIQVFFFNFSSPIVEWSQYFSFLIRIASKVCENFSIRHTNLLNNEFWSLIDAASNWN